MEEEQKIEAIIILEMMGRPIEHLKEVMNKLIDTIGKEKGIKVKKSKTNEPKKLENKGPDGKIIKMPDEQMLYTTFSEVEIEADNLFDLLKICFAYLPANMEIISPSDFALKNIDMNSLMNAVLEKMHNYDSIAKAALMENQMLVRDLAKFVKPKLEMVENTDEEDNKTKED